MAKKKTIEFFDGVPVISSKKDYLILLRNYICDAKNKTKPKRLVRSLNNQKNNSKKNLKK